jgi:CheY-like chemotaxis protein
LPGPSSVLQIDVPKAEPDRQLGVKPLGNQSCSRPAMGAGDALMRVDIAPDGVICELGSVGTGKDIIMTATRMPRGSVFLVEDEVMIRMMVADMLEELGYVVAAEAGEINEAIRLVQCTEFDLAILDVNVNGKVISPVAELISARKRPFIFATGYGSSGLPEEYRDRPALQKPFQLETLAKAIDSAMRSATV